MTALRSEEPVLRQQYNSRPLASSATQLPPELQARGKRANTGILLKGISMAWLLMHSCRELGKVNWDSQKYILRSLTRVVSVRKPCRGPTGKERINIVDRSKAIDYCGSPSIY